MTSFTASAMARARHVPGHFIRFLCVLLMALVALAARAGPVALRTVPGLDEPLVATAPTSPRENAGLDRALAQFRQPLRPSQDFADSAKPLNAFLADHPKSGWRLALLTNLGLGYYRSGYFTKATSAWSEAWQAGRHATTPEARALADRAVGELARMHARLGHASELEALFADIGPRAASGPATELIAGAREGLWAFRNDYARAYLCGPMALRSLLAALKAEPAKLEVMNAQRSGPGGFSFAQVSRLADEVGLRHRLVRRTPSQPIPVPSVVHWKLHHYAAIVAEKDGRYLVQDPTFASGDAWLTRAAIDEESSGYFLVPTQASRASPWREARAEETRPLYGMGQTSNNEPGDTMPDSEGLHPIGCDRMCEANAKTMLVSLNLNDTPVGYTPPKGPAVQIRLSYNQRESAQPAVFGFFNASPKWSLSVLSWIEDDPARPGAGVVRHVAGGGSLGPLDYINYSTATGAFGPERQSRAVLVRIPATGPATSYELRMPDGGKQVFAMADGAATQPRRMFLSRVVDPAGNALVYDYDAQLRLTTLTDATGRATTLSYEAPVSSLLVSRITDPFGRHADLGYDSQGRLVSMTDVIGITSSFAYDAGGLINAMTTPYGTSRFQYGENTAANTRFLEIADPLGLTERVEFRHNAPGIGASDARAPTMPGSPYNGYLQYRNSFHWDKHAQQTAAGDYTAARITHWLHTSNGLTSPVIESTKAPLESRLWRLYPGQGLPYYEGSSGVANQIARVLDDGSTQLRTFAHNALGKPTSATDPVGRTTTLSYSADGVDVLEVRQQTAGGTSEPLASYTYNARHRPLSATDAAGQTTTYSYNPAGQPSAITDPLGRTTRYDYDPLGRLTSIVNPDGSPRVRLSYDGFDRVATSTSSEGRTLGYRYDALDRVTQIDHPDGTSTQYGYDKLDRVFHKDRLGRVTRYQYDANRRLVGVTDALGQTTRYEWHANGVLKRITDPKGSVTAWDIDIQGRPTVKRHADGSTQSYAYGPASGRLQAITDALGQTKSFSYAADDRLAALSYANALTPTAAVSLSHDPFFPRVVAMTDGVGTTTYAYQPGGSAGAHQLAAVQSAVAGQASVGDSVGFAYDALGRAVERTVNGAADKRSYDALGRSDRIENALGRFDYAFVGASGRVASMVASSGPSAAMSYFGASGDELLKQIAYTSQAGLPLAGYGYSYDPNGNVTTFAEALPGEKLSAWVPVHTDGSGHGTPTLVALDGVASHLPDASVMAAVIAALLCVGLWYSTRGLWRRRSLRIGLPVLALALAASCGGGGSGGGGGGGGGGGDPSGSSANASPTARVASYRYDDANKLTAASIALNVTGAVPLANHVYGLRTDAGLPKGGGGCGSGLWEFGG